jgi:uncharacterized protein (DUF433 family)
MVGRVVVNDGDFFAIDFHPAWRGQWPHPPSGSFVALDQRDKSDIISTMDYRNYITIEPDKRSGKPCIRGLRITVQDVLEYLASGMTEEEILDDFPDLTREDIKACLAFAADRERKLITVPAA